MTRLRKALAGLLTAFSALALMAITSPAHAQVTLPATGFNMQDYIDALVGGYGPLYAVVIGVSFAFLIITLIRTRMRSAVAQGR